MSRSAESDELGDALASYLELERDGHAPQRADFARRHPRIEEALHACLLRLAALSTMRSPAQSPAPNEIGDFRILRTIGRGGMGIVYEAEQKSLPRRVALKVIDPGARLDAERLRRFRREVETMARVRHPNIVPVLQAGEHDGSPYYAMPLLQGESLDHALARWRVRPGEAPIRDRERLIAWLRHFVAAARALDTAHAQGVLHRDVKPSNLFAEEDGRLLVLDFGLTRSLSEAESSLTRSPVGTPRYMSPEQLQGRPLDGRSDQFSFAATLYEVLTLYPAFPGEERESVFQAILTRDPVPARRIEPRVPRDLEVIVSKALEKDCGRRYASLGELADDLERFLAYEPIRARPVGALGRLVRSARRNPAAAASIAIGVLALAGASLRSALQAKERTQQMVESALVSGRDARARLAGVRERIRALEPELYRLRATIQPWALLERKDPLLAGLAELEAAREQREQTFRSALTHYLSALELAPGLALARDEIAATAFDEYLDAEARRDGERMASLRTLALPYDRGSLPWQGAGSIAIASRPAGAEVFLFRCVDRERLRVPVPIDPSGALDEEVLRGFDVRGPWSFLRLTRVGPGGAPLLAGDELVTVCSEIPHDAAEAARHLAVPHRNDPEQAHYVELRRGGRVVVERPAPSYRAELEGERVESSAFPLCCTEANRWGVTPLDERYLAAGSYLAVLRIGGRDVRVPFEVRRGRCELAVDLAEAFALDQDFAYVPAGPTVTGGDPGALDPFLPGLRQVPAFFLQRREVTFGEYFEFVRAIAADDPELARELAPRTPASGPLWTLDADGQIVPKLPGAVDESWPAVGLSYRDAEAYCEWRNAAGGSDGVVFSLPDELEWEKAVRGADGRRFPWGEVFEWTFAQLGQSGWISQISRGGERPADESIYGVRDLCGNVREWCASEPGHAMRVLRGGGWSNRIEADCHPASRAHWREATFVDPAAGFRLVARPLPR